MYIYTTTVLLCLELSLWHPSETVTFCHPLGRQCGHITSYFWWSFLFILYLFLFFFQIFCLSALKLLVGQQEGHLACKKLKEWWGTGMVICLKRGAELHTAQLMPLPLTVSCFSKIQIGFTFLVPAHLSISGKRTIKRMYVCVCSF